MNRGAKEPGLSGRVRGHSVVEIETHDIGTLCDAASRPCHSERSEESLGETLRCAQGDTFAVPIFCGLI